MKPRAAPAVAPRARARLAWGPAAREREGRERDNRLRALRPRGGGGCTRPAPRGTCVTPALRLKGKPQHQQPRFKTHGGGSSLTRVSGRETRQKKSKSLGEKLAKTNPSRGARARGGHGAGHGAGWGGVGLGGGDTASRRGQWRCTGPPARPPRAPSAGTAPHCPPAERTVNRPGGNPGAHIKSVSHRCYPRKGVIEWQLTKETRCVPLGCLQDGNVRANSAALQTTSWRKHGRARSEIRQRRTPAGGVAWWNGGAMRLDARALSSHFHWRFCRACTTVRESRLLSPTDSPDRSDPLKSAARCPSPRTRQEPQRARHLPFSGAREDSAHTSMPPGA